MNKRLLIIPLVFLTMIILVTGCNSVHYQEVLTFSRPYTSGINLIIDNDLGDIDIQHSNGDEVMIKAIVNGWAADLTGAKKLVKNTEVSCILTENSLEISAITPGANFSGGVAVEYSISLPEEFDLEIDTINGDIYLEQMTGKADLKSRTGDLRIRSLQGSLQADLGTGDLEADLIEGEVTVQTSTGDIEAGLQLPAGTDNLLTTGTGDIDINLLGMIPSTLTVKNSNGDLFYDNVLYENSAGIIFKTGNKGNLVLETSTGDVFIKSY